MSGNFYNTINLTGEDLKMENAKAKAQGDLILAIFKANPSRLFSPSQLHHVFNKRYFLHPPITSIRRALTNLTKDGILEKTDNKIKGEYHLPEHTWKLATENLYKKENKSAGDIASEIIQNCNYIQPELFNSQK